jgi:hypothetical protein
MAPAESPFDILVDDFVEDQNVNITSAFAAAKTAVEGFNKLPSGTRATFVYTGNIMNSTTKGAVIPFLWSAGVGKSGASHMMATASQAYAPKGYQFFYADEVRVLVLLQGVLGLSPCVRHLLTLVPITSVAQEGWHSCLPRR